MKLICYFQIFFVKKKERNIYHVKVMLGKNFFSLPLFWEIWICVYFCIREKYIGDKTDGLVFPKRVIGCFLPEMYDLFYIRK